MAALSIPNIQPARPHPLHFETNAGNKARQLALGLAIRSANSQYELIIDNFAGGGGASTGIEQAFGRPVDIAINHDGEALAMHTTNHPHTAHYQEDVFDIHPGFITGQRPIGLAWFSPDCKHHSKAKGGKPREKKIRGLAWVTLKWGAFQMPRCIALENVEEFRDWGPLNDEHKPIKAEKGRTFQAFIDALSTGLARDHPDVQEIRDALGDDFPMERLYAGLGYQVEHRILRACDFGAPTIRKRLFIFARRDGLPICWPAPTHGNPKLPGYKESGLLPWLTAADCIDFSIPCPSIFDRKRPLKPKTLDRIGKGVVKFVINNANRFIINTAHGEVSPAGAKRWGKGEHSAAEPLPTVTASNDFALVSPTLMHVTHHGAERSHSIDTPVPTVTAAHRGELALVSAHITKFRNGSTGSGIDEPLHTICAGGDQARLGTPGAMGIVTATLEKKAPNCEKPTDNVEQMETFNTFVPFLTEHANASIQRNFDVKEPLRTQCAEVKGGHFAAVTATIVKHNFGESPCQSIESPLHTVTTQDNKFGLVTAILTHYHADKRPTDVRASEITEPVKTQTTENRHALVTAMLAKHYTGVVGTGVDVPFGTVTTSDHHSVVTANLVRQFGNSAGADVNAPVGTICAGGMGKTELVTSNLVKLRGTCQHGQQIDEPMPTISAQGTHVAEVRAFLIKYYGAGDETDDRIGLVTIEGEDYIIVDIGMRMLTPRELARAQGFPDSTILDPVVERFGAATENSSSPHMLRIETAPGTKMRKKRKTRYVRAPLSKAAQIRMIGNSVCPPLAKALIEVNFTHEQRMAKVA